MTNNTVIKDYSTALIKGFYERVMSIQGLKHNLSKGEIRELFLNDLLSNYLTDQFGIGTGIVVDSFGNQSHQMDIVIFDNRILPPMLKNSTLGVFPLESVLAIIEIKSLISKNNIKKTEEKFKHFDSHLETHKKIKASIKVVKGIIGFNKNKITELSNGNDKTWITENINHIDAICHVQKYSWIRWLNPERPWKFCNKNEITFEETKRFVAWILDIARSKSNKRLKLFGESYIPWLSSYIRDQEEII